MQQRRCRKFVPRLPLTQLVRSPLRCRDAARGEFKSAYAVYPSNGASSPRISRSSECRAVEDMISDATTRVFAPEDKLHLKPIGSSPLTATDLTRVLDHLSTLDVLPREFSMRLTEPDLTVRLEGDELISDMPTDSQLKGLLGNWNRTRPRSCIHTLGNHGSIITSVAILPDFTMVTGSRDGPDRLWSTNGKCIRSFSGREDGEGGTHLAAASDGSTHLACRWGCDLKLWDVTTGELIRVMRGHMKSVYCVTLSCDCRTIVTGLRDGSIISWNIYSGVSLWEVQGHSGSVECITFSPCGKTIVSGSGDDTIKVWDEASGILEQTLEGHADSVSAVAFSHDGAMLASGSYDTSIRLWDTETWASVIELRGDSGWVTSLAFSPCVGMLASGHSSGAVKVWNSSCAESIKTLRGHRASVLSVAISPDGSTLLSGSDDKTAKQWHIKHSPEIKEVCAQPTLGADIRLPSDDSPLYLADLARVVIHILATGLPRSFEMRLAHPPVAVSMDDGLFFETPSNSEVSGLLAPLNQSRLNKLVAQACTDAGIALPAASTAVMDPNGFISVSPADDKIAAALLPLNHLRLDAAVARVCAQAVTAKTAIRVTHADLPALKKLLARVEASRVAPRSFEVQLDDPAATVTLGPTGFEVAPPSDVVDYVVSGFSFLTAHLDAISTADEISLGEHAPLTIGDLKTVAGLLLRRETLPTSFAMRLTRPECAISTDRNGFFQSSPETAEVQTALNPLNRAQLSRRLSEICAEPITEETDLCVAFGSHVPCFASDLRRVLDHVTATADLPRSFTMRLTHPATTVTLGPTGFTATGASEEVSAIIEHANRASPVIAMLQAEMMSNSALDAVDEALYVAADLSDAKRLLAAAGPHATQHEARVLALRTDLARLQPVQALAKDPMPALKGPRQGGAGEERRAPRAHHQRRRRQDALEDAAPECQVRPRRPQLPRPRAPVAAAQRVRARPAAGLRGAAQGRLPARRRLPGRPPAAGRRRQATDAGRDAGREG
ncbi:WD40 repeat containing protein [Carpediemonas membranifera]|uniref:WD40 repeat containing protein n=1 Tax=Carpediemonas membranifera TaxID=201153 RepID=A0A8J6EBD9_9EUKA|nr:WD40 repeat containing protein [Carpediemonas membranifera]|eukprot:KAG9396940.1 WD40 repeat containing protein [Carpediemonas membranifera]